MTALAARRLCKNLQVNDFVPMDNPRMMDGFPGFPYKIR